MPHLWMITIGLNNDVMVACSAVHKESCGGSIPLYFNKNNINLEKFDII
jgi:hypothetical protein